MRVEALLEIVIHKFKDEVETRRLRDDLWKGEAGRSSGGERRGACVVTYYSVEKERCEGGNPLPLVGRRCSHASSPLGAQPRGGW